MGLVPRLVGCLQLQNPHADLGNLDHVRVLARCRAGPIHRVRYRQSLAMPARLTGAAPQVQYKHPSHEHCRQPSPLSLGMRRPPATVTLLLR